MMPGQIKRGGAKGVQTLFALKYPKYPLAPPLNLSGNYIRDFPIVNFKIPVETLVCFSRIKIPK